ncbi:DUF6894 family protein [Bradyrhizobium ottawaense]|uniref:DUF6894 domain-containing protein n=1 Tax=Bradyrhizobium ottawaense TaxID=931866 RepID=A0A2U8P6G6_9BRAD|nr:hypothetical protein CIT37_12895 [Bradyrhizobium ottawaense]
MPRFHFHILDGKALTDHEGLELPDIAAIRCEAIQFAGAVLRDHRADDIWPVEPWQMVVNDSPNPNTGRIHFKLTVTATE